LNFDNRRRTCFNFEFSRCQEEPSFPGAFGSTGSSSDEEISRTSRIGNFGFLMVFFFDLDERISLGRAFSPSEETHRGLQYLRQV
jgi:hypothetical protein